MPRFVSPIPILLVLSVVACAGAIQTPPPKKVDPPPATQPAADEDETKYEKITIKETEFKLEIAADDEARSKGLMGRDKLEDDKGMIFIYRSAAPRAFWMKDCLIDIDIIFLDSMGRVVATHEMKKEEPQREGEAYSDYLDRLKRYESGRPAQYGIELKAGTIKKLKLEVGDTIDFDRRKLSRMAK